MSYRSPSIPPEPLESLMKDHFPLQYFDAKSVKEFDGYADRNYYFTGELNGGVTGSSTTVNNEGCSSKEFVVKFVNSKDSSDFKILDGIAKLLEFLYERNFDCPYPIPGTTSDIVVLPYSNLLHYSRLKSPLIMEDIDDNLSTVTTDAMATIEQTPPAVPTADSRFCLRLTLFVKGELFGHKEQTPDLLHELGCYVGRMNKELMHFSHHGIANRILNQWDLKQLVTHRQIIPPAISDSEQAKILYNIIDSFEDHVVPIIYEDPEVKRGYIHNDINCLNIIVNNDTVTGDPHISGLIDFSNVVYAPLVFELGIAMAYLMMRRRDPAQYIKPFLQGYRSVISLTEKSLRVLYYVVLGRLAQSYLNGMYAYKLEPANEYVLTETAPGWELIKHLLSEGKDKCYNIWNI